MGYKIKEKAEILSIFCIGGHYWVVFFSYFNVTYHILAGTLTLDGLSATRFIKDQSLGMNALVNSYGLEQLTFSQISAEVTHPHFA